MPISPLGDMGGAPSGAVGGIWGSAHGLKGRPAKGYYPPPRAAAAAVRREGGWVSPLKFGFAK